MTRGLALFCLCCLPPAAVWAQSGIVAPRAGCVRDRGDSLRTVYGVAGVFLPGSAVRAGVVSAACSDQLAVAKTATALELRDSSMRLLGRWPAAPGPARFAFPRSGAGVYVYFSSARELKWFEPGRAPRKFAIADAIGGEALALAVPDPQHLAAVVRGPNGLRLVRILISRALVEQDLPLDNISTPVLLARDGMLVYAQGREVVIRRPNRADLRLELPAPAASIEPMGEGLAAIALVNRATPAVLRFREGREQVLRLPEAVR